MMTPAEVNTLRTAHAVLGRQLQEANEAEARAIARRKEAECAAAAAHTLRVDIQLAWERLDAYLMPARDGQEAAAA
jgi:hypothetical protein